MDGDDKRFIAFWELHETANQEEQIHDLNVAAKTPQGTNHYSFNVDTREELDQWREKWNAAGLGVMEIDHNWCRSIYTRDPNGNPVEFCLTTGAFTDEDRTRALAALDEETFNPTPAPADMKVWSVKG